jgi:diadenosine tetraphosphate (Ap4A) HIT family hydrolase
MPTVFSRIIEGEFPAAFVHRDDRCAVFMAKDPLARGHALVVPLDEVDHWIDLDDGLLAHLTAVARRVGVAQRRAFAPRRIGIIVAGYEVPHTHIHVIPTNAMGDLSFAGATPDVPLAELELAAGAIRAHFEAS